MRFRSVIGAASLCAGMALTVSASGETAVAVHPVKGVLILDETAYRLDGASLPHPEALCKANSGTWRCGETAWTTLQNHVMSGRVGCRPLVSLSASTSTTDSLPAECTLNGASLNTWLVRYGWALADDSPAAPFQEEEMQAQQEALGIWRDGFMPPSEWRAAASSECNVCSARHESIVRSKEKRQQTSGSQNAD
jgi:endonuclease YncB( thermonuclease family)